MIINDNALLVMTDRPGWWHHVPARRKLQDFILGTIRPNIAYADRSYSSFEGFMKFQAARLWIPPAGIARRLDIPPQAIRRLDVVERNSFRFFPADRFARSNESTDRKKERNEFRSTKK